MKPMTEKKEFLPPPSFHAAPLVRPQPHFLTPSGLTLLPCAQQPPPMYGKRGATVPAQHLPTKQQKQQQHPNPFQQKPKENVGVESERRQYCPTCEMELCSQADMRRHRAQHVGCAVVGCRFRALPAVMETHAAAVHASGLADKVKKLTSPEEIARWREERRKRFPTVANVAMRQEADAQRQRRGERMEPKMGRFAAPEDRHRERRPEAGGAGNKWRQKRLQREQMQKDKACPMAAKGAPDEAAPPVTADPEAAKQGAAMANSLEATVPSAEGVAAEKDAQPNTEAVGNTGAGREEPAIKDDEAKPSEGAKEASASDLGETLSSVRPCRSAQESKDCQDSAGCAASLDGSGANETPAASEERDATSVATPFIGTKEMEVGVTQRSVEDDDEAPAETPIGRNNPPPPTAPLGPKLTPAVAADPPRFRRHRGLDYSRAQPRRQFTLLEKLLEPEIRHEHNVLLQCVRFVCERRFFGVGEDRPPTPPNTD